MSVYWTSLNTTCANYGLLSSPSNGGSGKMTSKEEREKKKRIKLMETVRKYAAKKMKIALERISFSSSSGPNDCYLRIDSDFEDFGSILFVDMIRKGLEKERISDDGEWWPGFDLDDESPTGTIEELQALLEFIYDGKVPEGVSEFKRLLKLFSDNTKVPMENLSWYSRNPEDTYIKVNGDGDETQRVLKTEVRHRGLTDEFDVSSSRAWEKFKLCGTSPQGNLKDIEKLLNHIFSKRRYAKPVYSQRQKKMLALKKKVAKLMKIPVGKLSLHKEDWPDPDTFCLLLDCEHTKFTERLVKEIRDRRLMDMYSNNMFEIFKLKPDSPPRGKTEDYERFIDFIFMVPVSEDAVRYDINKVLKDNISLYPGDIVYKSSEDPILIESRTFRDVTFEQAMNVIFYDCSLTNVTFFGSISGTTFPKTGMTGCDFTKSNKIRVMSLLTACWKGIDFPPEVLDQLMQWDKALSPTHMQVKMDAWGEDKSSCPFSSDKYSRPIRFSEDASHYKKAKAPKMSAYELLEAMFEVTNNKLPPAQDPAVKPSIQKTS